LFSNDRLVQSNKTKENVIYNKKKDMSVFELINDIIIEGYIVFNDPQQCTIGDAVSYCMGASFGMYARQLKQQE